MRVVKTPMSNAVASLLRSMVKDEVADNIGRWEVAGHMFDDEPEDCAVTKCKLRAASGGAKLEKEFAKAPGKFQTHRGVKKRNKNVRE